MPLGNDIMYLFHIRPEAPGANFAGQDQARLFRERLVQYGSYVAEIAASLTASSDIVYSPIEPLMLPWPWCRGRVVIGGDAAHTFAPHLTQGAAMAAEDAFVLVREVLDDDVPVEAPADPLLDEALSALRFRLHVLRPMAPRRAIRPHGRGSGSGPDRIDGERIGPHRRQRPHPQRPFLSRAAYVGGPSGRARVRQQEHEVLMSSNRVKVGIVGLGRWAKVLTRAARTSDAIEIVSGFSRSEESRDGVPAGIRRQERARPRGAA